MAKDTAKSTLFDRPIVFEQDQTVTNAQGGRTPNWVTIYPCMANFVDRTHARGLTRMWLFMQAYPLASRIIQIRYFQSIYIGVATNAGEMRIRYTAHGVNHFYRILGVQNPNEANVSIWLACQEDQAKAAN